MPIQTDTDILVAALIGYQARLRDINTRISELRGKLGKSAVGAGEVGKPPAAAPKRVLSAEGRARIIAATKKRWEEARKAKSAAEAAAKAPAKPAAKKAAAKPAAKPARKPAAKKAAPSPAAEAAAPATE